MGVMFSGKRASAAQIGIKQEKNELFAYFKI